MASSKLLKEAIADAKAVRETALANAKLQLEEAFTPRLKSILSQKLRAEAEDMEAADEEMNEGEEGEAEEEKMEEELSSSNIGAGDGGTNSGQTGKEPAELDSAADEDELGAADVTKTSGKPEDEVEDYDFAKSITEEDEMEDDSMAGDMDGEQSEDDLDLESIIRELEDELGQSDDEEFGSDDEMHEDADNVDDDMEADNPNAYVQEGEEEGSAEDSAEDADEFNIEEIIRELEEEEAAEEAEMQAQNEVKELRAQYNEAINVIKTLKSTISEINLLNAKLLYSNKLFRGYNLTNEQKAKVIDAFDRTGTTREVKLVYSTIAESFKMGGNTNSKKVAAVKTIAEGASRPQKTTGVEKQIISENSAFADRFKQLAGLIK